MDAITRYYFGVDRITNTVLRTARGVVDGLWLGVLTREQFARIDTAYYADAGQYLDEGYNRSGLFPWERAAVDRHFGDVRRLVVTCAGAGREVLALATEGRAVTGYEPLARLVDHGNALLAADGLPARLINCDRDHWPVHDEAEGAIVGWGGYMLVAGRRTRVEFLRGAARSLPVGAPLLLSFFADEGVVNPRLATSVRIARFLRRALGRADVEITRGDALLPNLVHFFTRDEVAAELADAGFELVDHGVAPYGWAVAVRSEDRHRRDAVTEPGTLRGAP